MKERFLKWLNGDQDLMEHILDETEEQEPSRLERKERKEKELESFSRRPEVEAVMEEERKAFQRVYLAVAIVSCIALISVLLYVVSSLSRYGVENPLTLEVVRRYVEDGLRETGAVNIVSGLILDYRAFDTLGESHVLFTALVCVTILLRIDSKNMRTDYEDYYTIRQDQYFDLSKDSIIRLVGSVLVPSILLFGIYVILNGQISPGGGFSGGAVMGAGLTLFSVAFGLIRVFHGCQRIRDPYPQRNAGRDLFGRSDPAAGYCGGHRGMLHHVRILQSVQERKCRRKCGSSLNI